MLLFRAILIKWLFLIDLSQWLAHVLKFKWCLNKILVKIHVYGCGGGTINQHLIFMMYVININTNPTDEDVFILLKWFSYKHLIIFWTCFMHVLNVNLMFHVNCWARFTHLLSRNLMIWCRNTLKSPFAYGPKQTRNIGNFQLLS